MDDFNCSEKFQLPPIEFMLELVQQVIGDLAPLTQPLQFSAFGRQGLPSQPATCHQFLPPMALTQHVGLFVSNAGNSILIFAAQSVARRLSRTVRRTDDSAQEKSTESDSKGGIPSI